MNKSFLGAVITLVLFVSPVNVSNSFRDSPTKPYLTDQNCPVITIECPPEVFEYGRTYTVTARVSGGNSRNLTYRWSVSGGKIVGGQGTSSIKVCANQAGLTPTATVEVGGLDKRCLNRTASCSFTVS